MSKLEDFEEIMKSIDNGEVVRQLEAQIPRVVAACRETNKVGSITLTLKFKPEAGNKVIVSPTLAMKSPAPGFTGSVMWSTEAGVLCDEDPKQLKIAAVTAMTPGRKN